MTHPFVEHLREVLWSCELSGGYKDEPDLERDVYPFVMRSFEEHFPREDVESAVITHGNSRWSSKKEWQDVWTYGKKHTGDIALRVPGLGTVLIQLKLAKDGLTSSLQGLIGQLVIGTLRHAATFGLLYSNQSLQISKDEKDFTNELLARLDSVQSGFLVIRWPSSAESSRRPPEAYSRRDSAS